MPVTVSLLDVVSVERTRPIWPEQFAALVAALEARPDDRDQMRVIADWLQENGEPALEGAFRYVAKRPEVTLRDASTSEHYRYWVLDDVPYGVASQKVEREDSGTAAGAFARLALQLAAARRDLE